MTTQNTVLPRVEAAQPGDLDAIRELLALHHLPEAGIGAHLASTLVARSADGLSGLAGCSALEVYGQSALLRSVAVAPAWQGCGLGRALTVAALDLARQQGVRTVYLLTNTAARFYLQFGFRAISRGEIDSALRQSEEFRGACPDSAQAMMLELSAQG
ncbi:MAG: GNAT family N-acetyltransferase [Anaerolineae bacterium]|nr:GNAT family N-acetyltransferase [Anaerolineae bacterium]